MGAGYVEQAYTLLEWLSYAHIAHCLSSLILAYLKLSCLSGPFVYKTAAQLALPRDHHHRVFRRAQSGHLHLEHSVRQRNPPWTVLDHNRARRLVKFVSNVQFLARMGRIADTFCGKHLCAFRVISLSTKNRPNSAPVEPPCVDAAGEAYDNLRYSDRGER